MKTQLLDFDDFQKAVSNSVNIDSAIEEIWDILCQFQKPITTWARKTDTIVHKGFMFMEKREKVETNIPIKDFILIGRYFENGDISFKYEIEKYYPVRNCQGTCDVIDTCFIINDKVSGTRVLSYNSKIEFITRVLGEIYTWGTEFSPCLKSVMSVKTIRDNYDIYNNYTPHPKKI